MTVKNFTHKIFKNHAEYLKLVLDERFNKLWPGHSFTMNIEGSPLSGIQFTVEKIKDIKSRTVYFDKGGKNLTGDENFFDQVLDRDDGDGWVTRYMERNQITKIIFPCEATLVCVYWNVENKLEKVELSTDLVFGPWQLIYFPELKTA